MKRQIDGEDINGKDEELFAWFNEEMNQPPCILLVTLYTILSVFCGFVAWHIPVGSIYFGILSAICLFIAVVYFSIEVGNSGRKEGRLRQQSDEGDPGGCRGKPAAPGESKGK